eukprot:402955_1
MSDTEQQPQVTAAEPEVQVAPVAEVPPTTTDTNDAPVEETAAAVPTETVAEETSAAPVVDAEQPAAAVEGEQPVVPNAEAEAEGTTAPAVTSNAAATVTKDDGPNPYAHGGADPFPSNSDVLRMRGLPYTATEEDIRAFYDGYDIAE